MLSRRETLRGGSAAVAAIAVTGAVAAAVPAIAISTTSRDLPSLFDEPIIALVDEMDRIERAMHDIERRTGDLDGNADSTLTKADCKALMATKWRYRDQWCALEDELTDMPARSLEGVLAKLRAWFTEDEREKMLAADGEPWDPLPATYVGSIYRDLLRLAGEASS